VPAPDVPEDAEPDPPEPEPEPVEPPEPGSAPVGSDVAPGSDVEGAGTEVPAPAGHREQLAAGVAHGPGSGTGDGAGRQLGRGTDLVLSSHAPRLRLAGPRHQCPERGQCRARKGTGSTTVPFSRTSKCRCGPVA
jgi:hypothetical protein